MTDVPAAMNTVDNVQVSITRIYVEPGPFNCEVLRPGITSPPPEVGIGPLILPGR